MASSFRPAHLCYEFFPAEFYAYLLAAVPSPTHCWHRHCGANCPQGAEGETKEQNILYVL